MKLLHKLTLVVAFLVCSTIASQAQDFAIKNNVLYDATLTPNIGAEVALSRKSTFQLSYSLNPWELHDGKQWKHWQLAPEYRYWLCSKFSGHFFGIHGNGGEFNFRKVDITLPFTGWPCDLDNAHYQGWNIGGGLTYGYAWILSKHWNFEASISVGYEYIKWKRYNCANCDSSPERGHRNYVGPTKAALNLVYVF